jgi:putative membrane protein
MNAPRPDLFGSGHESPVEAPPVDPRRVFAITRPDRALLTISILRAALSGPFAFVLLIPFLIKYYTLRYRFDPETVSMSWGLLFRQETFVPYARIQDIHLTRTLLERWLGIGTVEIQTASSTTGAEESLVGLRDYEVVRDYLYQRMRGHDPAEKPVVGAAAAAPVAGPATPGGALSALVAIRDELRATRAALEAGA